MAEDFKPQTIPFGRGSLDLKHPVGEIAPENYSGLLNAYRRQDGLLVGRPGLTSILTGLDSEHDGGGVVNSICRLNLSVLGGIYRNDGPSPTDPLGLIPNGVRFLGTIPGSLFYAPTAAAHLVATGFSGNQLCFLPYRPPLAATPWLYIGDSAKMAKASPIDLTTALVLPLGLPAPTNPDARMAMDEFPPELYFGGWDGSLDLRQIANFTLFGFEAVEGAAPQLVSVQTQNSTLIDDCESIAPWTANAGSGGAPALALDIADFKAGLASIKITSNAGAAAAEYYNYITRALSLDLTRVGDKPATDEDHIHGWIQLDDISAFSEIRFYFILSDYSATALPGDDTTSNKNFYVKAIRSDDFTSFLAVAGTALASQTAENTSFGVIDTGGGANSTAGVPSISGGKNWTEFGALNFPLRRGDFKRYGDDQTKDWSDVVGMTVLLSLNTNTTVRVWMDDLRFVGGAGPDSSIAGDVPYDYRYRNYDPRTGVKGNPCPISLESFWVDPVRQAVLVRPNPNGDPEVRQQVFRRGGVLTRAWYFVGMNGSDGGQLTDTHTDASIINAEILQEDNDQPVTTVDAKNNPVLAQPLHTIFGPVDDTIFGLGDPFRKGDIYWCKKGDADAWPPYNHIELCGTAEELIAGYVFANQPFAMSREQGFVLFPNMGGSGQVGYAPTGCKRGPVQRTAYSVGIKGCYFVARDGFYGTTGGPEECLSTAWVDPLFKMGLQEPNTTFNGLYPIDYRFTINVATHGHDVWVSYFDTQGDQRILIFDIFLEYWRPYTFQVNQGPFAIYSEPAQPLSLLLGGTGKVYSHEGTSDDGLAISGFYKSASLDQDVKRADKQYGDIWLQGDGKGQTLTVTALLNDETISLTPLSLSTAVGQQDYILDPFDSVGAFGNPGPREARSLSLKVAWSSVEAPPLLRQWGLSFLIQPETTKGRPTDWDPQGRLTDKQVKGILLECDTGGVNKDIVIEADGVAQLTITVNHNGRLSKHYAWPEFLGRMLRFNPVDTVDWKLYNARWIFDEEPAQLDRWETQLLDHGLGGWHSLPNGYITYKTEDGGATKAVTLEIDVYDQAGAILQTITPTPTLDGTKGVKIKRFVGFPAHRGVFFRYKFTSSSKFWLYREETKIFCQPWDGGEAKWVNPFGDDGLDLVRGLHDAGMQAARSGGGS